MKFEKSIATFLAALMSLVSVAYPVLAATNLGQYPGFLINADGSLGAYVVVGASASSQDVIGATDLASRLAQAAAITTTVPGTSAAINGLQKDEVDINFGNMSVTFGGPFPDPIRNFHYSGLLQGTISYKGNTYNYHEALALGDTYFSHDFGTAGINGTETMVVHSNQIKYEYVFDSALNCTALATTTPGSTCTLTTPEYTNPVKITLLGKPFVIVGIGGGQVIMLSGSVGTATSTSGVTFGSYTLYSDLGYNGEWARVVIKDASGNTVETKVINEGDSFDFTAEGITVKVTSARALQDGTVVGTDVVVGTISAVQKTYTTSCDVTSTGTSDTKFPGETSWCIQVSGFANSGAIAVNDKIDVVYKPQISPQYLKYTGSAVTLPMPNSYGEIGFPGWNYNTFATLTLKVVEGISGYHMIGGGATNQTVAASNLNGIEIDSDTTGSIVDPNTVTGYSRAYILFNTTFGSTTYPVLIGFWDSTNSRVGVNTTSCGTGALNDYCAQLGAGDSTAFKFTISYGGGANLADWQYLYVNVTDPSSAPACQLGGTCTSLFYAFQLGTTTDNAGVVFSWVNKTSTWSSSQPPTFRLYTTDSAEDYDVAVTNTPSGGGAAAYSYVGKATQDVVANTGAIILAPISYTASNQVLVKVPAQALAVKAYVGKVGTGATVGGTYQQIVPITQSIAKLDSEVTAADKLAKDFVLVGGPCVNTLVAELAIASGNATAKFPYACTSWPARNFGRIQVIDDAFATGHQVIVVAGTRAADTRLAAQVLMQYDTLLTSQNASAVEVTSLSASGITPV